MENITKPVQDGVSGVVNTVKGVGEDVVSVKFYKSPALYIFLAYVAVLIGLKFYMNENTLNTYLYGDNKDLSIFDLFSYPYGVETPENIIKTSVLNPYILYLFAFTIMYPAFMEIKKNGSKPFLYGAAVSTGMVIGLFLIHVALHKTLVDPKTIEISPGFSSKQTGSKKEGRTYSQLYRGHWMTLFIFSPIYAFIVVYLARKLG